MEKSEKNNNKTSEHSSDLDLLTDFIKYQSEHSRWSTAITLLISITVASLIALLGYALQYQNLNFFNTKTPPDTALIQIDSIRIGVPKYEIKIKQDTIDSISNAIEKRHNKILEFDTMSLKITKSNNSGFYAINAVKDNTTTLDQVYSNNINSEKDSIIAYDIQSVKLKCLIENKSESKLSIFHILFTSITFLSLIFTLFIYILRRNIYKKILPLKEKIEKRNIDSMLVSLTKDVSMLVVDQKLNKGNKESEERLEKIRNFKKILDELLKDDNHEKAE